MPKFHIDYNFINEPQSYGDTVLVQLGRLYCEGAAGVDKHAHMNLYELTIVIDGEGEVVTNDVPVSVTKGDIYFSYPGDLHEIRSSSTKPLKYDFFAFNTQNIELKRELKYIVSFFCNYEDRVFRDSRINSTVESAIAELGSKDDFHEAVLALLFEQVIYYVIRNYRTDKKPAKSMHTVSADEICFQIMHYIDTHIYSIENLSSLSDKFSYNYSYLSDMFKRTTGNTISDYYQTRRLDVARFLVTEGRLTVGQIAEMLRYSSLYTFSKAFKNKYGTAPKFYGK